MCIRDRHTKTANVEFVSSNPTGPLTAGHGRNTILGDMVSSILTWHGYSVTREYYYNNAGKQMRMLAASTYAKYATKIGRDVTAPENGYIGEYLDDIVNQIIERFGENLDPDSICLLYTSPSPRDGLLSRMPSSA